MEDASDATKQQCHMLGSEALDPKQTRLVILLCEHLTKWLLHCLVKPIARAWLGLLLYQTRY